MAIDSLIAITSFLIGLGTTLAGAVAWYSSSVRKKYAAEREFNHLRNNQEQMRENIKVFHDEAEERFTKIDLQLIEIKAYLIRSATDTNQNR